MIKQIKNSRYSNMIRVEFMLGNLCNHKCHYCFPGSNEGDLPWVDLELAKNNLSHLLNHYKSYNKFKSNIFIIGGEPTLWNGLTDFCKHLKENFDIMIELSTNGSRKGDWWKKNAKYFDHVTVSVHHEYSKIDQIIEVCDILYEENVFLNASVMMDPTAWNSCLENVENLKLSKYKWPIVAKLVLFDGVHRYVNEQLSYFTQPIKRYPDPVWYKKNNKRYPVDIEIVKNDNTIINVKSNDWIIKNNLNYFKGWECNLGVDIIKIFTDGRITGNCQQSIYDDFNLYQKDFKEKFKPIISPVICTKSICSCAGEVNINKINKNI